MISILHRTKQYRGDHEAEIAVALEPIEGETIAQLIARTKLDAADWIEVRVTRQEESNDIAF